MGPWRWVQAAVLSALVHQGVRAVSAIFILAPYYLARGQLWRSPSDRHFTWAPVVYLFLGFSLAYIYKRVRTVVGGEGWGRGLRFGFWVWVITSVPTQGLRFVLMPIPIPLAVGECIGELIAFLASGLLFAWLLEPRPPRVTAGFR